jgi:hypothetical protein
VGRFLFVIETAERNIFLIVLMALFLNSQGRAEFPVQILCFLMNRRAFQTFDAGCTGEKGLQDLSSGFQMIGHTIKKSQGRILKILCPGQMDCEGASFAWHAFNRYPAFVCLDDMLYYGKPKSGAA